MPLSPFFANVVLIGFDREVVQKKWKAVRYADDLIFFGHTESECREIAEQCKHMLGRLGLEIPAIGPESKSSLHAPHEAVEFLGLSLEPTASGYMTLRSQASIFSPNSPRSIAGMAAYRLPFLYSGISTIPLGTEAFILSGASAKGISAITWRMPCRTPRPFRMPSLRMRCSLPREVEEISLAITWPSIGCSVFSLTKERIASVR